MKREAFLVEFLGTLGAESVIFTKVMPESISGVVHYQPSEGAISEEEENLVQDFKWNMHESDVPKEKAIYYSQQILK